jgi:hypothetical protein
MTLVLERNLIENKLNKFLSYDNLVISNIINENKYLKESVGKNSNRLVLTEEFVSEGVHDTIDMISAISDIFSAGTLGIGIDILHSAFYFAEYYFEKNPEKKNELFIDGIITACSAFLPGALQSIAPILKKAKKSPKLFADIIEKYPKIKQTIKLVMDKMEKWFKKVNLDVINDTAYVEKFKKYIELLDKSVKRGIIKEGVSKGSPHTAGLIYKFLIAMGVKPKLRWFVLKFNKVKNKPIYKLLETVVNFIKDKLMWVYYWLKRNFRKLFENIENPLKHLKNFLKNKRKYKNIKGNKNRAASGSVSGSATFSY